MAGNELGHLKHVDLALASKNHFQLSIGIDVALIDGILQAMGLNVLPELLHHLPARQWSFADNCFQLC